MDEEQCAAFFFAIERVASEHNRRKMATRPLRREVVDEMHAEAQDEASREAVKQETAGGDKGAAENPADAPAAREAL